MTVRLVEGPADGLTVEPRGQLVAVRLADGRLAMYGWDLDTKAGELVGRFREVVGRV